MELKTDRLILREIEKSDFDAIHSFGSNLDNVKYMAWGPNDEGGTNWFIDDCIKHSQKDPRIHFDFAITLKDSKKLIGTCGIYIDQGSEQAKLGWILHKDYWKKGYMTEAGKALINFGFGELCLHRIYAEVFEDNYGSYRVMENIGMRREGHFIKNQKGRPNIDPDWISTYQYAILKEEWAKS